MSATLYMAVTSISNDGHDMIDDRAVDGCFDWYRESWWWVIVSDHPIR